jgi:starch synthase
VPIVRAVGGLDDAVEQFDPQTLKGTGFKFKPYTGEALAETLQVALRTYGNKDVWQTLMRNGMAQDLSWPNSAREYVKVYQRVKKAGVGI